MKIRWKKLFTVLIQLHCQFPFPSLSYGLISSSANIHLYSRLHVYFTQNVDKYRREEAYLSEAIVKFPYFEMFKRLRTALSCQCSNSDYLVHFFSEIIYSRELKFLQVIYESFDCDLTHEFFIQDFIKYLFMMT